MAFIKCVPASIECIMTGILQTFMKLNAEIIMRLVPLIFYINSGISITNYNGMYTIMSSSIVFQFTSVLLIKYVFERNEFADL
jgi:hypothetical protein